MSNSSSKRRAYQAPTLRTHGTVAEITLAANGGAELDNAGYVSNGTQTGPTS